MKLRNIKNGKKIKLVSILDKCDNLEKQYREIVINLDKLTQDKLLIKKDIEKLVNKVKTASVLKRIKKT